MHTEKISVKRKKQTTNVNNRLSLQLKEMHSTMYIGLCTGLDDMWVSLKPLKYLLGSLKATSGAILEVSQKFLGGKQGLYLKTWKG